ncbi:MAG: hypothetical protein JXR83_19650 [Deltaproteobacteria bacterium]|nr:hypothetical protein [Deltaproteobacteria bacterium]
MRGIYPIGLALWLVGASTAAGCNLVWFAFGGERLPCAGHFACPKGTWCVDSTCLRCSGDQDCPSGMSCATEIGQCLAGPLRPLVAAGDSHTCAVTQSSPLKCWGANNQGQLGLGSTREYGGAPGEMGAALPAVELPSGWAVQLLAAGRAHTCVNALDATGAQRLACWGSNGSGQLGIGDVLTRGDALDEMAAGLKPVGLHQRQVAQLVAGKDTNCILTGDGEIDCWGDNGVGQLGLGDTLSRGDDPDELGVRLQFVDLAGIAKRIAHRGDHGCAVIVDGRVKCWGGNASGQLGLDDTRGRGDEPGEMGILLPPVDLGFFAEANEVVVGSDFSCALLPNGDVRCWGANDRGQLGLGDTAARSGPGGDQGVPVDLDQSAAIKVVVAGDRHACALFSNGGVRCWGDNAFGQLGLGDTGNRGDGPDEMGDHLPPISLGSGRTASAIAAGAFHTCALLDDGALKCWGRNDSGQLGLGDTDNRGDGPDEMGDRLPAIAL